MKKCLRTSQIRQMNWLKMFRPFGRIIPLFLRKFRIIPCFYMIRIRFFGLGELIQRDFRAAPYLTESTWTPKIQIKYVDTKKPTRRHTDNFTRDERRIGKIYRNRPKTIPNLFVSTFGISLVRHCTKPHTHDLWGVQAPSAQQAADLSAGQSEFPARKIRATRKPRNDDTCVEFFDLRRES